MDIQIFDNFEEDGQLTLFGMEEDIEELQASVKKTAARAGEQSAGQVISEQGSAGIRIQKCSSCGKMLFVREDEGGYISVCNACGIQYVQK